MGELSLGAVWSKTSHLPTFACFLNGFSERCVRGFSRFTRSLEEIEGARIDYLWGEERGEAERIAEEYGMKLVEKPEDMVGTVDGVLVLTRFPDHNLEYARPFLEAGVPTFVDKPFAPSVSDAYRMVELSVKYGTPLMSTSALRYAVELEPLKKAVSSKRDVWGGYIEAPGDFRFENTLYGIHAVEILSAVFGAGICSVFARERGDRTIVEIGYADGKTFVIHMGLPKSVWYVHVAGKGWEYTATVENTYAFYRNTILKIVEMVETGKPPIPITDTLEVFRTCIAVQMSVESGIEVVLEKDLPVPSWLKP